MVSCVWSSKCQSALMFVAIRKCTSVSLKLKRKFSQLNRDTFFSWSVEMTISSMSFVQWNVFLVCYCNPVFELIDNNRCLNCSYDHLLSICIEECVCMLTHVSMYTHIPWIASQLQCMWCVEETHRVYKQYISCMFKWLLLSVLVLAND